MANGGHLGMPNCKKIKTASYNKHSGTKLDKFQPMVLETSRYCHFCVYAIFGIDPWWPSWIVNLHTFEIVPLRKSKQFHTRNILAQSLINFNQWFLRYCYFRVYAIFSNGPWWPSWIVNLHKHEKVPLRDH